MPRENVKKQAIAFLLVAVIVGAAAMYFLAGNQSKPSAPSEVFSVDSAGKVLTSSDDEVTMDVPADALINQTNISISPIQDAKVTNYTVVSAYQLGPEGTCFIKPATLSIKYDPSTLPSEVNERDLRLYVQLAAGIVEMDNSSVDVDNHVVSGQVFHFSSVLAAVSNSKSHSSVPNIVGRWNRLDGIDKYVFTNNKDRFTMTMMGDITEGGKWEYNGPSGYDYIIRWEHSPPNPTNGTFIDTIFIANDNQSYVGYNNYGAQIHCVRASAPSEAQINATAPDGFKVGKVVTLTAYVKPVNAWYEQESLQKLYWSVISPDGTSVLTSNYQGEQTKFTPKIPGDYFVDLSVSDIGEQYEVLRGLTIMPDVDISVTVDQGTYGPNVHWKVTNNGQFPVDVDTIASLSGFIPKDNIDVGHDWGNWATSFSILPGKTENILQPTGNEFLLKGTVDSVSWCAQVYYQHKSYPYWLVYTQNPESDINYYHPIDFGNSQLNQGGWFNVEFYYSLSGVGFPIGRWVP